MSEQPSSNGSDEDTKADAKAIMVMFATAILMAVHFVSGFSFDF